MRARMRRQHVLMDGWFPYVVVYRPRYGLRHFLFDCLMLLVTGGLWLIWMIIR